MEAKTVNLVKGGKSAVLLSVLIHFAIFALTGGVVIYSVTKKKEPKFIPPPPVERPKMALRKPRVRVKKSVKPAAARRIVSAAIVAMPDIPLPEFSGLGEGLAGGPGGFELQPDPSSISLYGGEQLCSVGNDFEGTLYAFNYSRNGVYDPMEQQAQIELVKRFLESGWSPYVFAPYYRAPKKIYTTHFMIPPTASGLVPRAFDVNLNKLDQMMDPARWLIHYKGRISSRTGGRFRFWGSAIDMLFVRVRGEIVLNASVWPADQHDLAPAGWERPEGDQFIYPLGYNEAGVGSWFTLAPGEVVEMEVVLGEYGTNISQFMLLVEDAEESAYYSRRDDGMMILPAFKTTEFSPTLKKKIQYTLVRGDADLEGGPIFNVY